MRAHPRVCGENGLRVCFYHRVRGSSPRVRGKPQQNTRPNRPTRLIPACAGKTQATHLRGLSSAAHPRVCGENIFILANSGSHSGSSPRVRGKRCTISPSRRHFGLIPACAGKTIRAFDGRVPLRAHPRVCGENESLPYTTYRESGSSPRVRGKLILANSRPNGFRLIPACAGKTSVFGSAGPSPKAHPRVCGENVGK